MAHKDSIILQIKELLSNLPSEIDTDLRNQLAEAKETHLDAIIVLDDDPTGTQTVHDIPVLTQWDVNSIQNEFARGTSLFYILTNSRSLTEKAATDLALTIGQNIRHAATELSTRFWVISRSDSTLRGHYPAEVQALAKGLQIEDGIQFIIPEFFEGGRYTVDDIHYVMQHGQLVPAAETPFANDAVFGYENSDLKKWIEEKTVGAVKATVVASISLQDLQKNNLPQLIKKLSSLKPGSCCVVNAVCYQDLELFSLGLINAGIQPVFRTAASYVAALGVMAPKELLHGNELISNDNNGGVVVVGSYVPITNLQLDHLLKSGKNLIPLELSVLEILNTSKNKQLIDKVTTEVNQFIGQGKNVVLFTSRKLITGKSHDENQEIGQKVSQCITNIISGLKVKPRFLISKGGITSSDLATEALGVKKAMVKGQIIKGVPVWELGAESKFPGLHQVIFPGNVGDEQSLLMVFNQLKK